MKEEIKKIIELGCSISIPFKPTINSWFSELKLSKLSNTKFILSNNIQFNNIDDAIDYFLLEGFSSKNIGYIQDRLIKKGVFFDDYDLEYPNDKTKEMFDNEGILVDEEFKKFNITLKELPSEEEGIKEIEELVSNITTVDDFVDKLSKIYTKYYSCDPRFNILFVYEMEHGHVFKKIIDFEELNSITYAKYTSECKVKGIELSSNFNNKNYNLIFK